jgi:hypothetical protein
MNDDAIKQFADLADALQQHVRELSPTVVTIVSSTNKANQDVRVILKPASIGSAPLASAARNAVALSAGLNDRLVGMRSKIAAVLETYQSGMKETGFVAYELAMIEDTGKGQHAEDKLHLGIYIRHYRLTRAEWTFFTAIAFLQVCSMLDSYNEVLRAYLGFEPGRRINVHAAAKEVADKLNDGLKDFLVFPGYSKIKKLLSTLMESPAKKAALSVSAAVSVDEKVHRFEAALMELLTKFDHADAILDVCSQAVAESRATLEDASDKLLVALGKDEA